MATGHDNREPRPQGAPPEADLKETQPIPWYRVLVEKETLARLTKKSDLRGLLHAGGFLLLYAATTTSAVLLFRARLWVPMLLVCYLHGVIHNLLSMAAAVHELSHGTVFRTRWLNELFYHFFCFLTWNNPVHFRASHMLHHQLTVYRGRDKEVMQGPVAEKLNWKTLLAWLTFDAPAFAKFLSRNVLHAVGRADAEYFFWNPLFAGDDPRRRAMCRWARLALLLHLALIVLFVLLKLWVLIYLVSFGCFFASLLSKLFGALQHTGLAESTPDWRVVCHTVRFGPVLGYLYWHMNYHAEHHMYAAVPCYNLARFHRAVEGGMQLPIPSFASGLRLLAEIRRRQKLDPAYIHVPEFPATAAPPKRAE